MSKLSNIIEERFIQDIATEGLNWRIARMGTIIDLIVYSFVSYKNSNNRKHLEDIMLWILKGKIIYRLGELSTLRQTNTELLDYLNLQQPRVTNTFYLLLQEFEHLSYGTNYNLLVTSEKSKKSNFAKKGMIKEYVISLFLHFNDIRVKKT